MSDILSKAVIDVRHQFGIAFGRVVFGAAATIRATAEAFAVQQYGPTATLERCDIVPATEADEAAYRARVARIIKGVRREARVEPVAAHVG